MGWIALVGTESSAPTSAQALVQAALGAVEDGAARVWLRSPHGTQRPDETAVAAAVAAEAEHVRIGVPGSQAQHLLWLARRLGTLSYLTEGRLDVVWDAAAGIENLLWLQTLWSAPEAERVLGVAPSRHKEVRPEIWLRTLSRPLAAALGAGRVASATATHPDGSSDRIRPVVLT